MNDGTIKGMVSDATSAVTRILGSASKLVFIGLAVTSCVAFLYGILEAKDFMLLASMAFAFYFSKPDSSASVK